MATVAWASAVGPVVGGRPVVGIEIWVADLAGVVWIWGARVIVRSADPAMGAAFLTKTRRVAALGGRAAFAVAADPTGDAPARGEVVNV